MKRPMGVTIIAIIAIIAGVLQFLGGLGLLGLGTGMFQAFLPGGMGGAELLGALGVGAGVAALVMAVLYVTFGVGALGLRSWAWTLGVVLYAVSVIAGIIAMVTVEFSVAVLVSTIVAAAILAYLMTSPVRAAFGHESRATRTTHHGGGRPVTHA